LKTERGRGREKRGTSNPLGLQLRGGGKTTSRLALLEITKERGTSERTGKGLAKVSGMVTSG